MHLGFKFGCFVALCGLTACSGGGSGGAPLPSRAAARAVATITIPPKRAATARRRDWVSPSTQSIAIAAIRSDGDVDTTEQALTATTNGCTLQTDGSTLCKVPFAAPVTGGGQTDEFQINLVDTNLPDEGSIVSYGDSTGNVVSASAANTFAVVLGGVIGNLNAPGGATQSVTAGTAATLDIPVNFKDPDLNPITGPFDVPATVTIAGTAAASFALAQRTVGAAGANGTADVLVTYNGSGAPGSTATLTVASNSPQTASNIGGQCTTTITLMIGGG